MKKHLLVLLVLLPIFISVAQNNNSSDDKLLTFKNSIDEESIGKYAQAILTLMKIYHKQLPGVFRFQYIALHILLLQNHAAVWKLKTEGL